MNIRALISQEKSKFFDRRTEKRQQRIISETAELEKEKARQKSLAEANKKRERLQQEVGRLSSYNQRVAGPTKFQRFGKGLAAITNKGRQGLANAKKAGFLKGPNVGGPSFGINNSVFDLGKKEPKKEKPKAITIKINQ